MSRLNFKVWVRRIHLWIGLSSGLIVFIVGLTGATYAFEKEIRNVIHADVYQAENLAGKVLPLDTLVSRATAGNKKLKVKQVIVHGEGRSVQVNLKNKTGIFVHPKSGKVLGTINQEKEFLGIVLKIHRELYLGEVGKKITGISCLVFFISLLSGLILWWPSKAKHLAQRLKIEGSKGKKRFNYDLHRSLGFYASFVLIIISLSGLVFSFKWMEKAVYFASGSVKKEKKYFSDTTSSKHKAALQPILEALQKTYLQKPIVFVLPDENKGSIRATVQVGSNGLLTVNDHYFFDQYSSKVLAVQPYQTQSLGEKLRAGNYNFHTGKAVGFVGEVLVFLAGLIASSLPITGFIIWKNKGKKTQPASIN